MKITFLSLRGSNNVYVNFTLLRPHLCDFTEYIIVVDISELIKLVFFLNWTNKEEEFKILEHREEQIKREKKRTKKRRTRERKKNE